MNIKTRRFKHLPVHIPCRVYCTSSAVRISSSVKLARSGETVVVTSQQGNERGGPVDTRKTDAHSITLVFLGIDVRRNQRYSPNKPAK